MPISMTRAEYEAKYGAAPSISAQSPAQSTGPVSMTHAEYMAKYGGQQSQPDQSYQASQPQKSSGQLINSDAGIYKLGKALTSSEQNFGQDIAGAASNVLPESLTGVSDIKKAADQHAQDIYNLTNIIKDREAHGYDATALKKGLQTEIQNAPPQWADLYPSLKKSTLQVLGDAGGTALDIAAAGSLKGAKGFALAPEITKTAEETAKAKEAYNALSTGQKVAQIAGQTAKTAATGAGIGYGYDVTQKAQNNQLDLTPGLGTAIGAAAPLAVGATKAAMALGEEGAPRIINSLIGTRKGDFSYGKNPGRAIAESGIVANSLPDLQSQVTQARQTAGSTIGEISNKLEGKAEVQINNALSPIDEAIKSAQSAPRTNRDLITRLQNVKDDLLQVANDANGNPVAGRDLTNTSFDNAFALKKEIGNLTKFTGNVSDDSIVNSALKRSYGSIKGAMNEAAMKADPELGKQLMKANEKYADFTSAEVALKNRVALNQGKNLMSFPVKIGTVGAATSLLATGGFSAIPLALGSIGAVVLDKSLASTAVKTRIASWLAKESPLAVAEVVAKNPSIGSVLKKAFSKEYAPVDKYVQEYIANPSLGLSAQNITSKISTAERGTLRDFTDLVNGAYKPDAKTAANLKRDAQEIADKYGFSSAAKGDKSLARQFSEYLDSIGFDKKIKK